MKPIEVKNFFEDPDTIRNYAFTREYFATPNHPNGGNYPGFRSQPVNVLNDALFQNICRGIYDALGLEHNTESQVDMFFQYVRKEDEPPEWVHRDDLYFNPNYVGLIYLHPDPPPNTGTALYRPKNGETLGENPNKDSPNRDDYELEYTIENEYNKLVIYSPLQPHDSLEAFGDDITNSRLFIVFFMRTE